MYPPIPVQGSFCEENLGVDVVAPKSCSIPKLCPISCAIIAAVTTSSLRYSFTDDLPNLELLHVPLTQAIPTTPPWSFWEQRNTYALPFDVEG